MNEEVNNLEIDDQQQISQFKLNTLIFCSNNNISLHEQQMKNYQVLQNQSSIDVRLQRQIQHQASNAFSNSSKICEVIPEVEVQEDQNIQMNSNNIIEQNNSDHKQNQNNVYNYLKQVSKNSTNGNVESKQSLENNKTDEQNNNNNKNFTFEEQYTVPNWLKDISQNSQKDVLLIDVKSIQKQMSKENNNNSSNQKNQDKSNIDGNQIQSNSQITQNGNGQSQKNIDDQTQQKLLFNQEEDKFSADNNDNDDSKFSPYHNKCLTSAKKSQFHYESNQQEEKQYFFSTEGNEQATNDIKEFQYFNHCFSKPESPNVQITKNTNFFRSKSMYFNQSKGTQKLQKVTNAIITIQRLLHNPAKRINSINQLEDDFRSYRQSSILKSAYQSEFIERGDNNNQIESGKKDEQAINKEYKEAFAILRRREKLSQLCERGSEEDVKEIQKMIDNDPKKYLRDPKDPNHFLNIKNQKGQTPFYIACKNGNFEVVKLLLAAQCNYTLKSDISKNLDEAPFEAAIRWNHIQIINLMLDKCNFDDKYLVSCIQICPNHHLKVLIQSKIKKKSSACAIF